MAINQNNWISSKIVQDSSLTLKDFLESKEGTIFDVLYIQKLAFIGACFEKEKNIAYHPADFFNKNRYSIIKTGEYSWKVLYENIPRRKCKNIPICLFEAETDRYVPLTEDGYYFLNNIKTHYTNLSSDTKIGINGPVILWEKLETLPPIINDEKD